MSDAIVEEIHRIREKMLEDCGGDVNALMDKMAAEGGKWPSQVQSPEELRRIANARTSPQEVK